MTAIAKTVDYYSMEQIKLSDELSMNIAETILGVSTLPPSSEDLSDMAKTGVLGLIRDERIVSDIILDKNGAINIGRNIDSTYDELEKLRKFIVNLQSEVPSTAYLVFSVGSIELIDVFLEYFDKKIAVETYRRERT